MKNLKISQKLIVSFMIIVAFFIASSIFSVLQLRQLGKMEDEAQKRANDAVIITEAAEMGIAFRAVPTEEVLPAAMELARRLAGKAPIPLAYAKRLIGAAGTMPRGKALKAEGKALQRIFATRDWQEGLDAFHEGRDPEFRGE